MLPARARVLDVGCGYGRVALPLARAGFDVEGLDLADNLIDAARASTHDAGLGISFAVGSMTRLPYPSASFDAAICLWSAFHELLDEKAQTATVSELWRGLRPGGFALVEGPLYEEPDESEITSGTRRGPEHRIVWGLVQGVPNPHYAHDLRSLRRVCEAADVSSFDVFERVWGGRQRLFLRLDKPHH